MFKFRPGDRVKFVEGSDWHGRIGYVSDMQTASRGIIYVHNGAGRYHIPMDVEDLRPAFQSCKDCDGKGRIIPADRNVWCLDCGTCLGTGRINRTGPYRQANGTWSDGVERKARIEMRAFGDANPDRVRVLVCPTCFDKPGATVLQQGAAKSIDKCFPTFAEAIVYADRMARSES